MLDKQKLKQLEGNFLMQYPGGFENPEMLAMRKKHPMERMTAFAHESFYKNACGNVHVMAENMMKLVSRSSMVSMFEKPKFRDFVKVLGEHDKAFMVNALNQFLHGDQQAGFEGLVDILRTEKLAKWSLVSVFGAYFSPDDEVFVKPTTAKDILKFFELSEPIYKPAPTWDFYCQYRQLINEGKKKLNSNLSPSNAAFSGFLMMAIKM